MRSASKSHACGSSGTDDVASLEGSNRREVRDEVGYSKNQLTRIGTLQDFAADSELDVKRMWVGHFILSNDCWPKGGERIETLTQRPLTRSHLHVSRSYIVHDGVAEDVLLPSSRRNALTALPNDEREFGFVIGLLR